MGRPPVTVSVTVIDYGVGNLHSVVKAFRHEKAAVHVTSRPEEVRGAERLVLPGVGAFADGAAGLAARGLAEPIKEFVAAGRPFLGICLGMQLLLTESDEFGSHRGLDIIPGRVTELPRTTGLKVPHVGWNRLQPARRDAWSGTPLAPLSAGDMVYFVHSFAAVPDREEDRLAVAPYGPHALVAAVRRGNVLGCQFHPEKSGPAGLAVVGAFLAA
jgi:imidazole glycerol-phosphate synthase subunit HisH